MSQPAGPVAVPALAQPAPLEAAPTPPPDVELAPESALPAAPSASTDLPTPRPTTATPADPTDDENDMIVVEPATTTESAAGPSAHPPAPGSSTLAAAIAPSKPSTPVPLHPPDVLAARHFAALTDLLGCLQTALEAGQDGRPFLRQMKTIAGDAHLDHVFPFAQETDLFYVAPYVLLLALDGDLPSAINQLNSTPPPLKADPLVAHLATLLSGINENVHAAVWATRTQVLNALQAGETTNPTVLAFRQVFSSLLDLVFDEFYNSTVDLIAQVYPTTISLGEFAAYLGLGESDVQPAVQALKWTITSERLIQPAQTHRTSAAGFGQREFDRLARRVLALEQSIRVD